MDELRKYSGSKEVLRSNGLIHINVVQDSGSSRDYENVTLRIRGGEVYVVNVDATRSDITDPGNIVEASSYGGIYQGSGFYVPAESER